MFGSSGNGFQRVMLAAIGALVLSTTLIGLTVTPVQAAEACLVLPASLDGEQLVCSHA